MGSDLVLGAVVAVIITIITMVIVTVAVTALLPFSVSMSVITSLRAGPGSWPLWPLTLFMILPGTTLVLAPGAARVGTPAQARAGPGPALLSAVVTDHCGPRLLAGQCGAESHRGKLC